MVRAVSAEDVSGASAIDPLPEGRSGAGLYAIERAIRIWRNEHHLAILRAQERCSTAVSRKSPKAVPLASACVRRIEKRRARSPPQTARSSQEDRHSVGKST